MLCFTEPPNIFNYVSTQHNPAWNNLNNYDLEGFWNDKHTHMHINIPHEHTNYYLSMHMPYNHIENALKCTYVDANFIIYKIKKWIDLIARF